MPTASYFCEFINTPHCSLYSDDVDIFYRHVHVRAVASQMYFLLQHYSFNKRFPVYLLDPFHHVFETKISFLQSLRGSQYHTIVIFVRLSVRFGSNFIRQSAMFCSLDSSHPRLWQFSLAAPRVLLISSSVILSSLEIMKHLAPPTATSIPWTLAASACFHHL